MRYPQGGGLTAERQAFREQIRMQAAARFTAGEDNAAIAKTLRVHVRSVQRWYVAWDTGGEAALLSKGPPNHPQLSETQFAVLETELERGPAAHGWPDQKWTLSRIKTMIGRRFHKTYTIQGVHYLLRRHGWSYQVPARRAIERNETAIAGWIKETWPSVEETRAALGAWLVFEDEAGFSMTPPTARSWSRRGHTPIVRVRGRSRRRLSIAALTCYKPGERSRLIYRPAADRRPDGRKSFAWTDYRDLLKFAHAQLGGPIVLVWDNLNTHLTAGMKQFITANDWLTVVQLPAYAPELNPVEGIWSLLRRDLANTAFADPEHMIGAVRRGLREIQYRPWLIDGALAGTGLPCSTP